MWNHTEYILVFDNGILEKQKNKYIILYFKSVKQLKNNKVLFSFCDL